MDASPTIASPPPSFSSGTDDAVSPSRKRSHHEMSAEHGNQTAPQIISSSSHTMADATARATRSATPPPSRFHGEPREAQSPAQPQIDDEELDPEEPLLDFDWRHLEERYHQAMEERGKEEQKIFAEFSGLMNYFDVWAATTSVHEVDRSYARLRTRIAHVKHSEDEVEQKREHYTKVVKAFESALALLNTR